MRKKINTRKAIILTFMIVIFISCHGVAFADSEFDSINKELVMEDEHTIQKAIGKGTIIATRESSTRIKYTFNTTFTPIADSVTMKVWKCTYSSASGTWVPQGAALSYSYSNVNKITRTGALAITSGKTYKVKVSVTEKRGDVTNNKTFFSIAI